MNPVIVLIQHRGADSEEMEFEFPPQIGDFILNEKSRRVSRVLFREWIPTGNDGGRTYALKCIVEDAFSLGPT